MRIFKSKISLIMVLIASLLTLSSCASLPEQAKMAEERGDYANAVRLYHEHMAQFRHIGEIAIYYNDTARLYRKTGDYRNAIAELKKGMQSYRGDSRIPEILRNSAHEIFSEWIDNLLAAGSYDAAVAVAKEEVAFAPDDHSSFITMAMVYSAAGKFDDAAIALKRVLESAAPDTVAYYAALVSEGRLRAQRGEHDAAINAYRKALDASKEIAQRKKKKYRGGLRDEQPEPLDVQKELGYAYLWATRYSDAAETFSAGKNDDREMSFLRAVADYYQGRYDQALFAVNPLIEKGAGSGLGINMVKMLQNKFLIMELDMTSPMAKAGVRVKDAILAIDGKKKADMPNAQFLQLLNHYQKLPPGAKSRWLIENKHGQQREVAVVHGPFFRDYTGAAYGIRSLILNAQGKPKEEVFRDAEKAKEMDDNSRFAHLAYGEACIDTGRYEEALAALGKYDTDRREFPFRKTQRILAKALAFAGQGKMDESIEIYGQIPDLDVLRHSAPLEKRWRRYAEMIKPRIEKHLANAEQLQKEERYQAALNELAKALPLVAEKDQQKSLHRQMVDLYGRHSRNIGIHPEAEGHIQKARVLIEDLKKYDKAAAEIKEAIRIAPYVPGYYYNLASAYDLLKDYQSAIKYMEIYTDITPGAPDAREAKNMIIRWKTILEEKGR